jgi:hypothetical protein
LLQTLPGPQVDAEPLGALPVSTHSELPLAQVVVPTLQAAGWQAMFATHGTQAPSLQTLPLPQVFPLRALPDSMHWDAPVAQEVVPVLQGLFVVHETSGVQEAQLPLLQ